MSALHWYTRKGTSWSDQPQCVSPLIRSLCISLNDSLNDGDRERVIGPHLFAPVGTNTGLADEIKRAYLCADRAVRVFAPYALRAIGLDAEAMKLESLPAIVDQGTADQACARAASAASAASAAWAARAARAAWAESAASAAWAARAARAAWAESAASWHQEQMIRLILDCCAIGCKAEIEATKTKEEVLAMLEE
jgi:hypothetical protein